MITFSRRTRRLHFCAVVGICVFAGATSNVGAQPPDAPKTPEETRRAQEPKALPLVTWDELQKQMGGPTLLTLHAKEMSAGDAIDALNTQSPVPIKLQNREYLERQNKQTLTADYEKQPYWTVLRDVAKKLGISIQNYGGNGVTFTPWGSENQGLASLSDAAIFNLTNANYGRYVNQGKADAERSESLSLQCTLMADPKLQWQNGAMAVHLTEALDDKNQSLLPAQDSDIYSNGIPLEMNFQLKPRLAHGGTVKRLRGTFHGAVAFNAGIWEVADVLGAKNVEKVSTNGETTTRMELQDVKPEGENYRLTLVISQSGPDNRQQAKLSTGKQVWMGNGFQTQPRLVDAKGRDLQLRSANSDQEGDENTRITTFTSVFAPNKTGEASEQSDVPAKLILPFASDLRELIIPFEFTDVNLP